MASADGGRTHSGVSSRYNSSYLQYILYICTITGTPTYINTETVFKENLGVRDPVPALTITSPYADSRVGSNTFTMGNPMPESTLILSQSWLYPPVRDKEFSLKTSSATKTWARDSWQLRICTNMTRKNQYIKKCKHTYIIWYSTYLNKDATPI